MDSHLAAAAASQVEVVLVSQEGETTVEESVARDGRELIDDLVFSHNFLAVFIHHLFPNMWLEALILALVIPLPMVPFPLDKMLLPLDKMLLPLDMTLMPLEGGKELTTG